MAKPTVSTTFTAVNKMTGPIKKMGASVKGFARSSAIAFGAVVGATGAVVAGVNKFAEAGDEIAKTSRKIGLSAEALQELRFAADRSGVSSEAFTTALEKMNKNVGDLRAGTGTLTTLLNKSNKALAEQLKLADSNDEAFTMLIDEISKIENPMDRAALAQAAFGRAGQDLIVMAENGTAGIAELRKEAQKYGNVISTEAANNSEKFVDSMTNMKAAINGVKNNALLPLMQTLQPIIQRMADWAAANQDLINQKITDFFEKIKDITLTIKNLWDSGLIPAVLAGVAAFKLLYPVITTIIALKKAWAATQLTLNAVLMANPIGLIIAGVSALIAITVLLIKNWEKVKETILKVWNKIKEPFEKVAQFFGGGIEGAGADIQAAQQRGMAAAGGVIPGGVIRNETSTVSRSTVDINMSGLPQGTSVRQTGRAPGVSLNYGYGGGRL